MSLGKVSVKWPCFLCIFLTLPRPLQSVSAQVQALLAYSGEVASKGWGDETRDRPKNATRRGLPFTETVTAPPPEPLAITVGHQGSLASCTLGGMGEFYFLQEGQLSRGGDGRGAAGPA